MTIVHTSGDGRRTYARRLVIPALVVALAAAGCGSAGNTTVGSTVAKPVAPPALPETTTQAARQPQVVEPPAGGSVDTGVQPDAEPSADTEQTSAAPSTATHRNTTGGIFSAADRASFSRLASSMSGSQGIAVSPLGLDRKVDRVGSLLSGVAWSTSKVPVAMAVIAAGGESAQASNLRRAITASDNAAAEQLWSSLGGGESAASAAEQQLRDAGDTHTSMESRSLRAGYTPFGQTSWALTDQTRFTAGLACSQPGKQVLALMNQVVAGQRWGLGSAGVDAQFKGGWGPGSSPGAAGGWLDRQMGILTIDGKPLAVTVATQPADGSHATGTSSLTALARWVVSHADVSRVPATPTC